MPWGERSEVRLSLNPEQRARVDAIAVELGISRFTLIRRLLMEEWDRAFGGEHATELAGIHGELHGRAL